MAVQGTAKLVVDLGNSETRVITMFGKNKKTGLARRKANRMSNRYAEYDPHIPIAEPVNADNSSKFRARGTVNGIDVDAEYVTGLLVDREYARNVIRPTATRKKYDNISTLLGLHVAFLEGYRAISAMQNVPIDQIDVDWQVTVLLPPGDTNIGAAKIAAILRSITEINFSMPEVHRKINIIEGGIRVIPEGFASYVSVVYVPGGGYREGYEYLTEDNVLIIDIGAGTTDFTVIESGKPIENTKHTENQGGNNIASTFRYNYMSDSGTTLSMARAQEAVVRGFVKDGARKVSVVEQLAQAKKTVASKLVNSLIEFFETTDYEPRSISYLLVVGGGAASSEVEGVRPIAEYLIDEMKRHSPNVGLVPLPEEVRPDGDGGASSVQVSPRNLNIKGAAILSE